MPDAVHAMFGAHIPFAAFCGFEEVGRADGRTRVRLRLQPHHLNNLGTAHGGLVATILDLAMGTAARTAYGSPVITLDMNVRYLSPGQGDLFAEGRVLKRGRSIAFCEAELTNGDGEIVARASGTMKVVPPARETEVAR